MGPYEQGTFFRASMSAAIDSPQNPTLQRIRRLLADASARRKEGVCVVEGPRLMGEALRAGRVTQAVLTAEYGAAADEEALARDLNDRRIPIVRVSARAMRSLADTDTPQGILGLAKTTGNIAKAVTPGLELALDSVQDPGNLGTLLRGAWAVGAERVILGVGCADAWSPKVLRSAMGAHFYLSIDGPSDLVEAINIAKAKGRKIFGADPRGATAWRDADLRPPLVLVIGAEGLGLAQATLEACDHRVSIDYPGSAESLNAGVTGNLLMFEALRQMGNKK